MSQSLSNTTDALCMRMLLSERRDIMDEKKDTVSSSARWQRRFSQKMMFFLYPRTCPVHSVFEGRIPSVTGSVRQIWSFLSYLLDGNGMVAQIILAVPVPPSFNASGYHHCNNGQGGSWRLQHERPDALKYKYVSADPDCPYHVPDTSGGSESASVANGFISTAIRSSATCITTF